MSSPDRSVADREFKAEYPGSDRRASDCYVGLVRVGEMLGGEMSRRLRSDAHISLRALMLLATLDGLGGRATSSEMVQHMPITLASITSLVDTCVRHDLVVRAPDPEDRRRIPISITTKGSDLMDHLLPGAHRLELQIMSALSREEHDLLLGLLAKVEDSVNAAAGEAPMFTTAPRHRPDRLKYAPAD